MSQPSLYTEIQTAMGAIATLGDGPMNPGHSIAGDSMHVSSSVLSKWGAFGRLVMRGLVGWLLCANASASDIVIAQVAPFSGPLASNGEANYAGAKAYFDYVNSHGGIHGRMIRFIREDDAYKPDETLRLMRLVAQRDQPSAFICALGSANIGSLLKTRTLEDLRIPVVGATPGAESLRDPGSPYLFHVQAGDFAQLDAILNHLATIGFKRIGVAYQELPFGNDGVLYVEQTATRKGLVVAGKVALPAGANDAKSAARAIRSANAQAYVMILAPNSNIAFIRDVRQGEDMTPIYGLSYAPVQAVVEQVGLTKSVGIALAQVTPNPESMTTQLTRDFRAAMQAYAAKDAQVSSLSLAGYVAAVVTVEGLKRAKSAEPRDVQAALRALKFDLGGLPIDFTDGRNVGSRLVRIGVIGDVGKLRY